MTPPIPETGRYREPVPMDPALKAEALARARQRAQPSPAEVRARYEREAA